MVEFMIQAVIQLRVPMLFSFLLSADLPQVVE